MPDQRYNPLLFKFISFSTRITKEPEKMPFRKFPPNAAFYHMMLISFFLSEAFKEDILRDVIPVRSHAGTVRRKLTDIAGKIVSHGGKVTLKFTSAVFRRLHPKKIWDACHSPPLICRICHNHFKLQ